MTGEAVRAVAERVRRETGVVVKEAQLPALEAAIGRAAPGMGAEQLLVELSGRAPAALWHRLVDEVIVPETYFFRERRELEAIDWRGLVEAAREGGSASYGYGSSAARRARRPTRWRSSPSRHLGAKRRRSRFSPPTSPTGCSAAQKREGGIRSGRSAICRPA